MKLLLIPILCITLTSCATWKPVPAEPAIVVQQEYIIRIPPAETMTLPPPIPEINVDTALQGDIAKWIVEKEERMKLLEAKLREIAKFFSDAQRSLDTK